MLIVYQLLVDISLANKHLSNANIEDISSECFSLFIRHYVSHDEEITVITSLGAVLFDFNFNFI
jgi:hypothetical protein